MFILGICPSPPIPSPPNLGTLPRVRNHPWFRTSSWEPSLHIHIPQVLTLCPAWRQAPLVICCMHSLKQPWETGAMITSSKYTEVEVETQIHVFIGTVCWVQAGGGGSWQMGRCRALRGKWCMTSKVRVSRPSQREALGQRKREQQKGHCWRRRGESLGGAAWWRWDLIDDPGVWNRLPRREAAGLRAAVGRWQYLAGLGLNVGPPWHGLG